MVARANLIKYWLGIEKNVFLFEIAALSSATQDLVPQHFGEM